MMTTPVEQNPIIAIDAPAPPEMAQKAVQIGIKKAAMPWQKIFILAILAGAFIALGAIFATTVTAGLNSPVPYGINRLVAGLAFCLGLILVVIAGAELFTGNNLIVIAWAHGSVSTGQLLRNWSLVYAGNLVGSLSTAVLMLLTKQYSFGNGAIGLNALNTANSKCHLDFWQAIALGMMCNALVCLAIWLCYSARTNTDKILSIIFPITAFVAAGFEHSVANMYFIPIGILIRDFAPAAFWTSIGKTAADYSALTWSNFAVANLLPVTIGNILGGAGMVGLIYWLVYLRKEVS
jgi:formate transporter